MISLQSLSDTSAIAGFKKAYLQSLTAPMDGMWDTGFTNPSPHWECLVEGERAGYVAASNEGVLLQFYVSPEFVLHAPSILDHVLVELKLEKAVVSTIDHAFFSLCLDKMPAMTASTFLYSMQSPTAPEHPDADGTWLRPIEASELARATALQNLCLGGSQAKTNGCRAILPT